MDSGWDSRKAADFEGELSQLVYSARLLAKETSLVLPGGGSASVKAELENVFGEQEEILHVTGKDEDLGKCGVDSIVPLRLGPVMKLIELDALSDADLENELSCNRKRASAPLPAFDSLLHAVLPHKFVHITQPTALFAVASTPSGIAHLRKIYGDLVLVIAHARRGFLLAKACMEALRASSGRSVGLVLLDHGLVTFADTAQTSYQNIIDLVDRAEEYLKRHRAWDIEPLATPAFDEPVRNELAALRQAVSKAVGCPVILTTRTDPLSLSFCRRSDLAETALQRPVLADYAAIIQGPPLIGRDVSAYRATYGQHSGEHMGEGAGIGENFAPRVVLDPELGICSVGRTAGEAAFVGDVYHHTIETILRADALEGYRSLPATQFLEAEHSGFSQTREAMQRKTSMFSGEVALVTGGASGIGKGCVESLLARGAAVVSLDINPGVTTLFDRPDYLGLQCDLTDEQAILQSFEQLVRRFGGLDMLVLNAGIFPPSCRIDSLKLADWQKVMRINLDSNLSVMREAYPLLKLSPRSGRVVVNASKNVLAPGAGVAAYSASKAATTQLARVSALEWGKDGIRVNMIHPDAVFDTGIWSEEKIEARAAHYGMAVQEYKTRNVLGVELNSHYVGELVAEMLGPLFEKITGAQIPVDGGSDRVI